MINLPQLVQMMRGSRDPMQMLMGMARNDPHVGQVLGMVNGKTPAEMQQMVYDIAQQRGVDIGRLAQQMGVRLPR